MNHKIFSIALLLLLCLSFAACGNEAAEPTEKTVVSSDGTYQLTVPADWEAVTEQSGKSATLSIQKNSVNYLALGSENDKGDLKNYSIHVTQKIKKSLQTKGKIKATSPQPFQAGKYQGYKTTIINVVEDAVLCSNIYCIKAEKQFVQINGVYVSSIQKEMSEEYDKIVQSLSVLKK